ncbi:sorbitol dehydrogenase [Durotheca rogersii]|uniref:sorbitol dehydrogenase n=1 Tax=Durotheca rogersii TaxID=419775 RepID=UPI00221FEF58|nr:sorbitol dehydrogenase [Durotheca rogersii]KAI5860972.1 sorbitol dehydrogenase [Durotheca rogersii]
MSSEVKASVLHGPKDLRVETRELPAPGPGEVQVAVKATGLCGSDLHYYTHFRNGSIEVREPLTLGHEAAGVVVAVGARDPSGGGAALAVGDRVALEVGVPCEACETCRRGRYNLCGAMRFRSSAKAFPHAQGTLQARVNHPARWCHRLPAALSLEHGALVEPLAVALHARARAALRPGAAVLVLGAGAVGLLCAAACRAAGARRVVVADILELRVRFALDHGFADAALVVPRPNPAGDKLAYAQDLAETLKALLAAPDDASLGEAAVTFECTGVESCMQTAIYATAPGGKVMIIGMGTPVQTLPIMAASLKEVDLVGVFRYANTYREAIELLSSGSRQLPDVLKLVTHRLRGLDAVPRAFETAARVQDDQGNLVIKVVVDLSE